MDLLTLIPVGAGIALVIFGRRLFWLLVAAAGFLAGFWLASMIVENPSDSTAVIAGILGGLLGAGLALFAQKVAITVGGFLAGGYALMTLLAGVTGTGNISEWIPFLVGGVAGALLIRTVFEWALIVLTSLIGAVLITHFLEAGHILRVGGTVLTILTVLIAAVGCLIQIRSKRSK